MDAKVDAIFISFTTFSKSHDDIVCLTLQFPWPKSHVFNKEPIKTSAQKLRILATNIWFDVV